MNSQSAKQVVLIRAIEQSDRDYSILDRAARDRATAEARDGNQDGGAILARRAEILCQRLLDEHPAWNSVAGGFGFQALSWLAIAAAMGVWFLISGLSKGLWGADRSINILIVPLLLLFLWNAAYLLIKLGMTLGSLIRRGSAKPSIWDRAGGAMGAGQRRFVDRIAEQLGTSDAAELARWRSVLEKFAAGWLPLASPLYGARIRCALHIAACLLVAGEFAYVYLKGVGVEYLATWESTWFSAETTHNILAVLLWPAWAALGEGLPSAAEISSLKTEPVNAAYWINLYLIQACVVVFVPRLILGSVEYLRSRHLDRHFPLPLEDDRYFQNLIHAERGAQVVARVVPYSFEPTTKTRDAIHDLLHNELGFSAQIDIEETVPYGNIDYPTGETSATGPPSWQWVLLFNLAQTPESEVQGNFMGGFARLVTESATGQRVAVVVDARPYRERLVGEPEIAARLGDRRATWQQLVAEQGLEAYFLGFEQNGQPPAEQAMPWYGASGK